MQCAEVPRRSLQLSAGGALIPINEIRRRLAAGPECCSGNAIIWDCCVYLLYHNLIATSISPIQTFTKFYKYFFIISQPSRVVK